MKLDHILLTMPPDKKDEARGFFVGILEMIEEEVPEPLASRGGCWFRKGTVILHVGVEKDFVPQKKAHPAFVVDDLFEMERKLKANNYEVIWNDELPNRTRFYSTDSFGNRIEFLKDGDGFSQK